MCIQHKYMFDLVHVLCCRNYMLKVSLIVIKVRLLTWNLYRSCRNMYGWFYHYYVGPQINLKMGSVASLNLKKNLVKLWTDHLLLLHFTYHEDWIHKLLYLCSATNRPSKYKCLQQESENIVCPWRVSECTRRCRDMDHSQPFGNILFLSTVSSLPSPLVWYIMYSIFKIFN